MTSVHVIDVGQGNMVAVVFGDGTVLVCDCNITDENADAVLGYLVGIMPKNAIDVFVNTHRDADHMRGIKRLHAWYPIGSLWDSGVSGNDDTPEYRAYMDFRRGRGGKVHEVTPGQHWRNREVRILNGKRAKGDINAQSIVLRISGPGAGVLLAGDTTAAVWRDFIVPESKTCLPSDLLLASHHGSISFFDDPRDDKYYYTGHLATIAPAMTIISVGDNPHGHPDAKALELYEKHARGSSKGNKIARTDLHGNIRIQLKDARGWSLNRDQ